MRANERYVWPWFAWLLGIDVAAVGWMTYLTTFVDDRWKGIGFLVGFAGMIIGAALLWFCLDGTTYRKRPRGWRKLLRDAEREQYIRDLEREMKIR